MSFAEIDTNTSGISENKGEYTVCSIDLDAQRKKELYIKGGLLLLFEDSYSIDVEKKPRRIVLVSFLH